MGGFKILRKKSNNYKHKLRSLRDLQIKLDAKRWAAITQRSDIDSVVEKLTEKEVQIDPTLNQTLVRKLSQQIEDEYSDLKLVQGNMDILPALRLLDDEKQKDKGESNGRTIKKKNQ